MATKGQQMALEQGDQVTYSLRAGDGQERVNSRFAAKIPDHLLPEGRRWPPNGQQHVLGERGQITYFLRAGDGHQMFDSRSCSKETRLLTN